MPSWMTDALERAFFPFAVSSDRFYWPNILAYFFIALLLFYWNRKAVKGFFNFVFPKEIYTFSASSFFLSDIIFFVFTGFVLAIIAGLKGLDEQQEIISFLLPYFPKITEPRTELFFLHALALHIAVDFGWYVGHYIFHKNAFLWEFHKVHHAPTALTPLTNKRFHLVEHTLVSLCMFVSTLIVDLVVTCLLVGEAGDAAYFAKVAASFAAIVFVVNIPGHLRHSHIWLSYGKIGNEIFLSPAMHQIHHSDELRHRDKNFGRDYSFFDRIFGTIYVPADKEDFKLGIGDNSKDYISFWECWYLPFLNCWELFKKTSNRRSASFNQHEVD